MGLSTLEMPTDSEKERTMNYCSGDKNIESTFCNPCPYEGNCEECMSEGANCEVMADREIVITHLQIIHTWAKFAREHDLQFFTPKHLMDIAQWADDAIAIMEEQEEIIEQYRKADVFLAVHGWKWEGR